MVLRKDYSEVLMIPLLKSRKLVAIAHSESGRRARSELKAPSTKATVKWQLKEATMPIAIMVSPTNDGQYKGYSKPKSGLPNGKAQSNWRPRK